MDLTKYPMDKQTCTLQLESCKKTHALSIFYCVALGADVLSFITSELHNVSYTYFIRTCWGRSTIKVASKYVCLFSVHLRSYYRWIYTDRRCTSGVFGMVCVWQPLDLGQFCVAWNLICCRLGPKAAFCSCWRYLSLYRSARLSFSDPLTLLYPPVSVGCVSHRDQREKSRTVRGGSEVCLRVAHNPPSLSLMTRQKDAGGRPISWISGSYLRHFTDQDKTRFLVH